jgi:hypothetical protein
MMMMADYVNLNGQRLPQLHFGKMKKLYMAEEILVCISS